MATFLSSDGNAATHLSIRHHLFSHIFQQKMRNPGFRAKTTAVRIDTKLSLKKQNVKMNHPSGTLFAPLEGQNKRMEVDMIEFHEKLPTLDHLKSLLVQEAMKRSLGNIDCAAEMLGLSRHAMLRYVVREFIRISDR